MFRLLTTIIMLVTLLVAGCGGNTTGTKKDAGVKATGYTVKDARGKVFTFKEKPRRIAGGFVFADEILLDLVDHKRIVGLTKWVHDPGLSSAVKEAEDVKGIVAGNVENMIALKPDLVLVHNSVKQDYLSNLEEAGLKVFVYKNASRISQIPDCISSIGAAVGEPERAAELNATLAKRLKAVGDRVAKLPKDKRKKGMLILRFGPIGGKGCIYNDVLTAAGVIDTYDIARPEHLKPGQSRILSKEELVKANPDFFIVSSWSQGGAYKDAETNIRDMYNDPALATVEAVKKHQAIIITQSYVNCLSHHVADGVEKLYEEVYEKR